MQKFSVRRNCQKEIQTLGQIFCHILCGEVSLACNKSQQVQWKVCTSLLSKIALFHLPSCFVSCMHPHTFYSGQWTYESALQTACTPYILGHQKGWIMSAICFTIICLFLSFMSPKKDKSLAISHSFHCISRCVRL